MADVVTFKARGAVTNPQCRHDRQRREAVDDGWELEGDGCPPPSPSTVVAVDASRSIITYNQSPDIGFDRSINPYRGCEHGCIYCFARPNHAHLGLSPGLDFETRLFVKPDAPTLLDAELRKDKYRPAVIAIGTNTDPYQPIERQWRVMRGCLEVLSAFHHPVDIVTKSSLVTRDIDILAPMAAKGLATVNVSLTTLDRSLSRTLEPRAAVPSKRLEAIRTLADAGIPVTVMVAPVIPGLNDGELEDILAAARAAGASRAGYILLRLPGEVEELFTEWLRVHYPLRARHILSLIRQCREGKLYRAEFGSRMAGSGEWAKLLSQRYLRAARKLAFDPGPRTHDIRLFKPPPRKGEQLSLL